MEREWASEGEEDGGDERQERARPVRVRRRSGNGGEEMDLIEPAQAYDVVRMGRSRQWAMGPVRQRDFSIKIRFHLMDRPGRLGFRPMFRQIFLHRILEHAFRDIITNIPRHGTAQIVATHPLFRNGIISSSRSPNPDLAQFSDRLCNAVQSEGEKIGIQDIKLSLVTFFPAEVRGKSQMSGKCLGARTIYDIEEWAKMKKSLWDPYSGLSGKQKTLLKGHCLLTVLCGQLFKLQNPKARVADFISYRKSDRIMQDVERWQNILSEEGGNELDPNDLIYLAPILALDDIGIACFNDTAPPFLHINQEASNQVLIFIVYEDMGFHAYGITRLAPFLGTSNSCLRCMKGYGRQSRHKCAKSPCRFCYFATCAYAGVEKETLIPIVCKNGCGLQFWSQACFKAHILHCTNRTVCSICKCSTIVGSKHECGVITCPRCNERHSPFEHCFISKGESSELGSTRLFFGDFETRIDERSQQHRVNLAIIQDEKGNERVYTGDMACADFARDLICKDSPYYNSYILFHNGAGLVC